MSLCAPVSVSVYLRGGRKEAGKSVPLIMKERNRICLKRAGFYGLDEWFHYVLEATSFRGMQIRSLYASEVRKTRIYTPPFQLSKCFICCQLISRRNETPAEHKNCQRGFQSSRISQAMSITVGFRIQN